MHNHWLDNHARRLATKLAALRNEDVVVLGIPRSGVPIAFSLAESLGAPLDVLAACALTLPFDPGVAFGAVAEDGVRVLNRTVVDQTGASAGEIEDVISVATTELNRRVGLYRPGHVRADLKGRVAVVVDSDLTSGAKAAAACRAARDRGASRVIFAAPEGSPPVVEALRTEADEVICLETPPFYFYATSQEGDRRRRRTTDADVVALLDRARKRSAEAPVILTVAGAKLEGTLSVPENACGLLLFAHSGAICNSMHSKYMAKSLNDAGFATVLLDLSTPVDVAGRSDMFAIGLLADQLVDVTVWRGDHPEVAGLPVGYFGTGTGAGAALAAAGSTRASVQSVVSRGSRPDLAGGPDEMTLQFNERARAAISCECTIAEVPRAGQRFDRPGALDQLAELARDWFIGHLSSTGARPQPVALGQHVATG
ncbi:putative phosphoribosyltransferase [Mycolicibacterium aurum]|uniref:Putative phosphoribosyltransferase n=1 Tax=Mycolicibacterium aurum TaxID=1791 RepID=A0A3S4VVT0_MYCAU|nr:putative phosphoribosyltransferase [Mycolicibacterium aurum]